MVWRWVGPQRSGPAYLKLSSLQSIDHAAAEAEAFVERKDRERQQSRQVSWLRSIHHLGKLMSDRRAGCKPLLSATVKLPSSCTPVTGSSPAVLYPFPISSLHTA
jgi:hypothetical protein